MKTARWGPAPPEGTVIGNKNSKKYHRPDRPGYRDMAEKNRVFFKTVAEAEAAGYKRAGNCPPEEEGGQVKRVSPTPAATAQPTTTSVAQTTPIRPSKPADASQAVSTAIGGDVIGNKNSKKYHLQGCPGYSQVGEKNRVMFKSTAEAEAAGYTKAGNCKK